MRSVRECERGLHGEQRSGDGSQHRRAGGLGSIGWGSLGSGAPWQARQLHTVPALPPGITQTRYQPGGCNS